MKIGILGSGDVSKTLALGFLGRDQQVMVGSREPQKLEVWKTEKAGKAQLGTFEATAAFGDLIVLSVKGSAAEAVVKQLAPQLKGKVVIDTTNPIADAPPQNGVLTYFTGPNDSLMERLQKAAPEARFVKAYNSVGSGLMVNPKLPSKPTMFICGNDDAAKKAVAEWLNTFGWEADDVGKVQSARALEPLCQLWCLPGLSKGDWSPHAFKMLR